MDDLASISGQRRVDRPLIIFDKPKLWGSAAAYFPRLNAGPTAPFDHDILRWGMERMRRKVPGPVYPCNARFIPFNDRRQMQMIDFNHIA
jgi:hypothetical protein